MLSTRNWLLVLLLCLGNSMVASAQKNKKFPLEDFTLFPPVAFLYGYEVKIINYLILEDVMITNPKTHYLKEKSREAKHMIEAAFQTLIGNATDYQEMQFDSLTRTLYEDEARFLFARLTKNRGLLTSVESLTMNAYLNRSQKKYSIIPYYASLGVYNKKGIYSHELDYPYLLIVENETKAIHYFKRLEFSKQRNNDMEHYKKQYALLLEYYKRSIKE